MLRNGLHQDGPPRLRQPPLFLLPLVIITQGVFQAPEAQTLAAEELPRFQTVPEAPIAPKLIAVGAPAFVALGLGRIQGACERLPEPADRDLLYRVGAERFALRPGRGEKGDGVQQRMAGRGGSETDRQEHGAPLPLALGRQGIAMVPWKGGVVHVRRAGEVVGNAGELVARENPKGVCPDLLDRGRVGNLVAGKQLPHAPGLLPRVLTLGAGSIHALLRGSRGRLRVLPDVRQEAGKQVGMAVLIAVDDKTEAIELGGPHREPFELIDRVIGNQGCIVRKALVGHFPGWQHALGPRIEGRHRGTALDFAFARTEAHIARFMFELSQGIQAGRIVEQALERGPLRGLQLGADHRA
jgi:hypothetical protein